MKVRNLDWVDGMEKVTRKQSKALILICPGPIGEGLTYQEAADKLGISKDSFKDRIQAFKKNFPKAWENFKSICDVVQKQRKSLKNPLSLDSLMNDPNFSEEDIVHKF